MPNNESGGQKQFLSIQKPDCNSIHSALRDFCHLRYSPLSSDFIIFFFFINVGTNWSQDIYQPVAVQTLYELISGQHVRHMIIMIAKHSIGISYRINNQVDTSYIGFPIYPAALKRSSSTSESSAGVLNYDAMTQPRCPQTLAVVDLHDDDDVHDEDMKI